MGQEIRPRIIAGFGRSGTTWVQDVVAQSNHLRTVFEPLHPFLLKGAGLDPAGYHEFDGNDPELQAYIEKFLFGDFCSLWADYRVISHNLLPRGDERWSLKGLKRAIGQNRQAIRNVIHYRRQRKCERRITKFVRANMMLSWLQQTFDSRIVYIVRHPAAVVLSQMRAPRAWHPRLAIERYSKDSRWLSTVDSRTADLIFGSLTDVEAHALHWCVEVGTALRQALESGIPVVFYEELVEYGRPEWQRILAALDLNSMPDDDLIMRPSQQAWGDKAKHATLVRSYGSWTQHGDKHAIAQVQKILDATSMNLYRVSQALPVDVEKYRTKRAAINPKSNE